MLITYNNTQINFEHIRRISTQKNKIIFQTTEGSETIALDYDHIEIIDEVANYIINCYKRGFKRLNLNNYIQFEKA